MPSRLSVVQPIAATNLILNPSLETNTTGWSALGAAVTVARTTAEAAFGIASLACTVTTAVTAEGGQYSIVLPTATTYYLSVWVKAALGQPLTLRSRDGSSNNVLATTFTGTGYWERLTGVFTTITATTHTLTVFKTGATATPIYIDAMQLEQTAYLTDYIDGDQPGCTWLSTAHASTSSRSAQYRLNGRELALDTLGVKVRIASGLGLMPASTDPAREPEPRLIQLAIRADGASIAALHALRQALIAIMQPRQIDTDPRFVLRYNGAGRSVEITCRYEKGLEGVLSPITPRGELIILRLLADVPALRELHTEIAVLDVQDTGTVNYVAGRQSGLWSILGPPTAPSTFNIFGAITTGPDGAVYFGGEWTNFAGVAACDNIAKYTPSTGAWSALGTGLNGPCYALHVDSQGFLWAGGSFTSAGGVANTNGIAYWSGSAWVSPTGGAGLGGVGSVAAIASARDGTVYIGGSFTTLDGVGIPRIASYTGTAWAALDNGISTGTVVALVFSQGGLLYVGGSFTGVDGATIPAIGLALWNPILGTWAAIQDLGGAGDVWAMGIDRNDILYVAGQFTGAGLITASNIVTYNGFGFTPLGDGTDNTIRSMAVDPDTGMVYVGGQFATAGGLLLADRVAKWNGWTWAPLDIDLPGTPTVYALHVSKLGRLYLGFDTTGSATYAAQTSVTYSGTEPVTPQLVLKRTSTATTLVRIVNNATGREVLFNLPLAPLETVTIDLASGVAFSDFSGLRRGTIHEASQSAAWTLQPGVNLITVFCNQAPPAGWLKWVRLYSSADAAI